jgi:oxygen-dependent protoporphyrinogen oxidase
LSVELSRIEYAGTAIVTLAYQRDQIAHALDGFGFVVPAVERRRILAGSFSSVKFPGRAPDDAVLVRVFVGGACQSELLDLSDDELRALVREELAELIGATGQPIFAEVTRWSKAMPQYHLGHQQLVAQIERAAAAWPNFALAGNAYHGVGIPNCVHSGEQAAERVLAALRAVAAGS